MLSYLNKRVAVAFIVLPNEIPNLSRDPLANKIPFEKLYLLRMRELNKAYSMQYIANESAIDNLYSWEALATERVLGTIIGVIGDGDCARQAAAAIRSSRVLETPEEVLFRTMAYTGRVEVCKLNPAVHMGLPTFVWESPRLDQAGYSMRTAWGWGTNAAEYEEALIWEHIKMYRPAIAMQQSLISRLVAALSQDTVIAQLHEVLQQHKVPKRSINRICAKVAAMNCLWTTEVPQRWVNEPAAAAPKAQSSTCVVEEAVSSSSSSCSYDCYVNVTVGGSSKSAEQQQPSHSSNSSSSGFGNGFWMWMGKAVAAAGVTVFGVLGGRHDPASATAARQVGSKAK